MGVVDTFMSEPTPRDDRNEEVDDGPADGGRTDGGRPTQPSESRNRGPPIPEPVNDETTVELVQDAIGVARGELSDEQFARKYGTTTDGCAFDEAASDG